MPTSGMEWTAVVRGGVQWEWATGEFTVLGLLFWELRRLWASRRQDRETSSPSDSVNKKTHGRNNHRFRESKRSC